MRILLFSALIIFFPANLFSQEVHTGITTGKDEFKPHWRIGPAFTYSVVNNRKEARGEYKPGIGGHACFYTSPWFSVSAEYSWFVPHAAGPAFADIHSWNAETNGNLFMKIGETDLFFKTLFGVSYMQWSGIYVGPTLNDNHKYYPGLKVEQSWFAGNLGCGVAYDLNAHVRTNLDFRMRFATEQRDLVSISDTGFFLGFDWDLKATDKKSQHKKNSGKRKTTKPRGGRLYKWLKTGA
jgi:hypothetical protein